MFTSTILCKGFSAMAPKSLYEIKEQAKILKVSPRDLSNAERAPSLLNFKKIWYHLYQL